MSRGFNALAATIAIAAPVAVEAAPADAELNAFGPGYSHNLPTANQQLDERLNEEGPNGCTAQAIGKIAGINTAAGRAKYITASNVDFKDIRTVTNHQYPTNAGATANCTPVEIPNQHSSSAVFDVELNNAPKAHTVHVSEEADGKFLLTGGVIRADCGGNPFPKVTPPKTHKHINEKKTHVDVTFGVLNQVAAFAAAEAQSVSSSNSTVTCPDGTVVSASGNSSAEASAIAQAAANIEAHDTFSITGNGLTFDQFQAQFSQDVASAEAAVNVAANSSSSVTANCGSQPPVVTFKPQPNIQITKKFVESISPDGSIDFVAPTNVAQDGDTVVWTETTVNTGNDALTTSYVDVPPAGESFDLASMPLSTQIDPSTGNANWTGAAILQPGASETTEYDTFANDIPCNTNTVNTVTVNGVDVYGNHVTSTGQDYVKDLNSGPDCDFSTGGAGQ